VKADAVPGRLNQLFICCSRLGYFVGQCSEICGSGHSFMPIVVEVVPVSFFFLRKKKTGTTSTTIGIKICPEPQIPEH